jgi:hypothetical protein
MLFVTGPSSCRSPSVRHDKVIRDFCRLPNSRHITPTSTFDRGQLKFRSPEPRVKEASVWHDTGILTLILLACLVLKLILLRLPCRTCIRRSWCSALDFGGRPRRR